MVDLIYPLLSYKIMAALFKVHNKLGPTHQEKHYQKAIAENLINRKFLIGANIMFPCFTKTPVLANILSTS